MNRVGAWAVFAYLATASPASGQWVCAGAVSDCFVVDSIAFGKVLDGRTGVGLQGVTVELLGRGAISETDSTGNYSFERVAPGFELLFSAPCYYSVRLARPNRLDLPLNVGMPRRGGTGCPAPASADAMSRGTWVVSGHMYSADPLVKSEGMSTFVITNPDRGGASIDDASGAFMFPLAEAEGSMDVIFQGMCWMELTVLGVQPTHRRIVLDVRGPYRWDPKYADLEGCGIRDPGR